jgi:hypothetical protein
MSVMLGWSVEERDTYGSSLLRLVTSDHLERGAGVRMLFVACRSEELNLDREGNVSEI